MMTQVAAKATRHYAQAATWTTRSGKPQPSALWCACAAGTACALNGQACTCGWLCRQHPVCRSCWHSAPDGAELLPNVHIVLQGRGCRTCLRFAQRRPVCVVHARCRSAGHPDALAGMARMEAPGTLCLGQKHVRLVQGASAVHVRWLAWVARIARSGV